jgi:alkylation response protein AidB-like acyl-CoA dehydrogenase
MPNYYTDNPDLVHQLEQLPLREVVEILEDDYRYARQYAHAPTDYADARDNYRRVLEIVGDIAANCIAPRAARVDEQGVSFKDGRVTYAEGTRRNLEQLAQADLRGIILPYRLGGLNLPFSIYTAAIEITSRADASLMNLFGLQDVADCINKYGTEQQRTELLPRFAAGEYTGAMALTEPEAGSDLQAAKLVAHQDQSGQWRLRGTKRFITNGCADVLLVLARSEPGTRDGRGLSLFVCRGGETVRVRRIEQKLGIRGSPTCELLFDDTPAELLGKRKLGLVKYVLDLMLRARIGIAAQAQGISQQAYEEAIRYARARAQFGKPICQIPAVANLLLEMRAQLEANRALLYRAALAVDEKERLEERLARLKAKGSEPGELGRRSKEAARRLALLASLAKLVLSESANRLVYDALQIHGGPGYMQDFTVERLARDVRITTIYEGTSQLQVIAATSGVMSDVLGDYFAERERQSYVGDLGTLAELLREIRRLYLESRQFLLDRKDNTYLEAAAKDLVELYGYAFVGHLLLEQAAHVTRKQLVATRYVRGALASARRNAAAITGGLFADVARAHAVLD